MKSIFMGMGAGLLLALLLTGGVVAQGDAPALREERQGDVRFMAGGVGLEERAAMDERAREFNLKLIFAMVSREYLSDVRVVIQGSGGKTLLSTVVEGPWMLVHLPQGDHLIQATMGRETITKRVAAGKSLQTLNFLWK